MKLYIWENPANIGCYGGSMVFAMAENLREARKMAYLGMQKDSVDNHITALQGIVLGKPTHIYNKPSAGCWSYQE